MENFVDPNIERTLGGTAADGIEALIGALPPPPPPPQVVAGAPLTAKEAKLAEKAFDRQVDQFTANRVNKSLQRKYGYLAQAVPGAEKIRVRKRRDAANLGYIGEWGFRDLASTGDLEVFVAKYVAPKHGPGEYDIAIIDIAGREVPAGSVFIEGLPFEQQAAGGQGNMVDLIRDLTLRASAPQQTAPDPIEQMRRAQNLAKELKESAGSSDPMAMMLAMQAMNRPAGPDPMILAALERLAAKLETPAPAPMSMLSPMPPAPQMDWIALGSQVVLPLLKMMQDSQNAQQQQMMAIQQQNMTTLVSLMNRNDGFTSKDAIAMMQDAHNRSLELLQRKQDEERPQNTLEDQMQALVKMKEFTQAFAPPQQPGPQGASFWDALVALASSSDMAGALADRIRQRNASEVRALPQASGAQVIQFPQKPQTVAVAAMPQNAQSQTQSPQQGHAQAVQIPLPASLRDDAAKITMAGDTGSRVQATVDALIGLQKDPLFSKFVMALLETTAKNETEKALHGLGRWLSMLIENQMLTRETAMLVLKDFKEQWDIIRGLLLEKIPMLKAIADANPVAEAAATPSPAPSPAPPSDPTIPNDVEVPDGYGNAS